MTSIVDSKPEAQARARRMHPSAVVGADARDLIGDGTVDAVIVATPAATHYELVLAALKAGKHVLVTKPLAKTSEQVSRLSDEAVARGLVLMVDHTFVYSGAVQKIRELVSADLGEVYYYDSVRVNLGLFQSDVDVIWDLAVHDLSIMDYLLAERPRALSATGVSHVPGGMVNTAYLTLFFDKSLIGHVHVNWLSPVKLRRTLIGGSRKMIVYDDLEPSEKVKVYDRGISLATDPADIYRMRVGYRNGDLWAPHVDITEALLVEAAHFIACVEGKAEPITDAAAGLRTVRLLEAASLSLKERGRPVELPTS